MKTLFAAMILATLAGNARAEEPKTIYSCDGGPGLGAGASFGCPGTIPPRQCYGAGSSLGLTYACGKDFERGLPVAIGEQVVQKVCVASGKRGVPAKCYVVTVDAVDE